MPKLLYILPIIATFGLASTLAAQETATEETGAATETEAAQPAETSETEGTTSDVGTIPELDMGEPADGDPTYVKETYGDWELKCFRSEAGEDPCQMFQLLLEDNGNAIAEFSIFRLPGDGQAIAGATIVVPLGTLLTEEMKISVDGGAAKTYSYRFCNLVGCFAQIGLTNDDIEAFKRGVSATLEIVPAQAPDQKVSITASLSGFTAAFENTSVLAQ